MAELRSLMVCCAVLLSCTGSQPGTPTPGVPTPVKATPTPVAEKTAVPQPEKTAVVPEKAAVVPEKATPTPMPVAMPTFDGEPEDEWSMPFPKGVVPAYQELAGVIVRPQEIAEPEVYEGPLGKVDECAGDPQACGYGEGVLGFHADGRVAVIEAPDVNGCGGDIDPLTSWGRVGQPNAVASAAKTMFRPGKGDSTGAGKAFKFVQARAKEGFKAPDNLVFLTGGEAVGISGVIRLAYLRAPLAGWLLHATSDGDIQLVDPGNKTAHLLGKVHGAGEATIEQVVIDPARTQLWVTLAFDSGEHCAGLPMVIKHWPVPAGVVATK